MLKPSLAHGGSPNSGGCRSAARPKLTTYTVRATREQAARGAAVARRLSYRSVDAWLVVVAQAGEEGASSGKVSGNIF
jgi:hypothetical protein